MIVRILGDGQYDVPDDHRDALDQLDAALGLTVDGDDDAAFAAALSAIIGDVHEHGRPLPDEHFATSELVLPFADATRHETKNLLDDGSGDTHS